jgi:hypothetical protein
VNTYFRTLVVLGILALFGVFIPACAAQTSGPEKGWLVIQGGGEVPDAVRQLFIALAGGPNANFILVPTALSDEQITEGGFIRGQGKGWANSWE